jgi:hypothetical protein
MSRIYLRKGVIEHLLQNAFSAGQRAATFNGRPGTEDAPTWEQWIKSNRNLIDYLLDEVGIEEVSDNGKG